VHLLLVAQNGHSVLLLAQKLDPWFPSCVPVPKPTSLKAQLTRLQESLTELVTLSMTWRGYQFLFSNCHIKKNNLVITSILSSDSKTTTVDGKDLKAARHGKAYMILADKVVCIMSLNCSGSWNPFCWSTLWIMP
jgi:hypothetical protein